MKLVQHEKKHQKQRSCRSFNLIDYSTSFRLGRLLTLKKRSTPILWLVTIFFLHLFSTLIVSKSRSSMSIILKCVRSFLHNSFPNVFIQGSKTSSPRNKMKGRVFIHSTHRRAGPSIAGPPIEDVSPFDQYMYRAIMPILCW